MLQTLTGSSMDTHQAAQGEALMGVVMEAGGRGAPANHRGCFRCAVALSAVMGLVSLALVIGFILHLFVITPSGRQEDLPLTAAGKVYLSSKARKEGTDTYDIFTVNKAANYLLYGWVKVTDVPGKEVTLQQTLGTDTRTIQRMKVKPNETEIFFNISLSMIDGIRISIYTKSELSDSLFHLYEL